MNLFRKLLMAVGITILHGTSILAAVPVWAATETDVGVTSNHQTHPEQNENASSSKNGMEMIDIQSLYKESMRYGPTERFYVPSRIELEQFSRIFRQVIHFHETGDTERLLELNAVAGPLGFEILQTVGTGDLPITVIREKGSIRGGRGFYALAGRKNVTRPTVVQTPHALSDAHTGSLGLATFLETTSSAFFSSTMRRSASSSPVSPDPGDPDDSEHDSQEIGYDIADAAHSLDHYFAAATQSYARSHPDLLVIQFHGFVSDSNDPSRDFDGIISSGREADHRPPVEERLIRQFKLAMKSRRIGIYGQDTSAYGALSNLQGQFIHSSSMGVFLHIELAHHCRKALSRSRNDRADLIDTIQRMISDYEIYQNR